VDSCLQRPAICPPAIRPRRLRLGWKQYVLLNHTSFLFVAY
jgi:hypothetical protein